jgi:hypothetical protein
LNLPFALAASWNQRAMAGPARPGRVLVMTVCSVKAMGVSLNQYLFDAKLQIVTDAKMMPIGTGRKKARR